MNDIVCSANIWYCDGVCYCITENNVNGSIIFPVRDLNVFSVHILSQINSFNVCESLKVMCSQVVQIHAKAIKLKT